MVERTILKPDSEEFKSLLEHHTSTNWDWCESAETVEKITRLQPIERGKPPVAALFQRETWFLNARHLFWYMPSFPTTETFAIRYANVIKYLALFTVKQSSSLDSNYSVWPSSSYNEAFPVPSCNEENLWKILGNLKLWTVLSLFPHCCKTRGIHHEYQ